MTTSIDTYDRLSAEKFVMLQAGTKLNILIDEMQASVIEYLVQTQYSHEEATDKFVNNMIEMLTNERIKDARIEWEESIK